MYTTLLFFVFTSRYNIAWISLYTLCLVFELPRQFESRALSLAENEEGVFSKKKKFVARTNCKKRDFMRLFAIRARMELRAVEEYSIETKDGGSASRISQLIKKVNQQNIVIDTSTFPPLALSYLEYFVKRLEKNEYYRSWIKKENSTITFLTGGVRKDEVWIPVLTSRSKPESSVLLPGKSLLCPLARPDENAEQPVTPTCPCGGRAALSNCPFKLCATCCRDRGFKKDDVFCTHHARQRNKYLEMKEKKLNALKDKEIGGGVQMKGKIYVYQRVSAIKRPQLQRQERESGNTNAASVVNLRKGMCVVSDKGK